MLEIHIFTQADGRKETNRSIDHQVPREDIQSMEQLQKAVVQLWNGKAGVIRKSYPTHPTKMPDWISLWPGLEKQYVDIVASENA